MTTRDKLLPENYQTYPTNSSDQQSGRYTEKAGGILTSSNYKRRIQTEDHQFRTSYRSSISIIVGTASIGTKLSNNTSLATKSYCPTNLEAYEEDNPHKANQDHPLSHLPSHLLENRSRPEQPSPKEYIVYSPGPVPTQHRYHPR